MRESEIPTDPHNDAPTIPSLGSPVEPVTLEAIWDKICHIERHQAFMSKDIDTMFKFVRSSIRQIEDSDIEDRLAALERVASGERLTHQNGSAE